MARKKVRQSASKSKPKTPSSPEPAAGEPAGVTQSEPAEETQQAEKSTLISRIELHDLRDVAQAVHGIVEILRDSQHDIAGTDVAHILRPLDNHIFDFEEMRCSVSRNCST
jgi:hypothetical protein